MCAKNAHEVSNNKTYDDGALNDGANLFQKSTGSNQRKQECLFNLIIFYELILLWIYSDFFRETQQHAKKFCRFTHDVALLKVIKTSKLADYY